MLLHVQPLTRIAALKTTAIFLTPKVLRISLGAEPIPVPEPFAACLDSVDHTARGRAAGTGGNDLVPRPH
jgi:hypothetical protein